MNTKDYIEAVKKTESMDWQAIISRLANIKTIRLLHAAIGLSTEANEFLDAMKKFIFYGKELDRTNLIEELGDGNWYQGIAINELQTSFEEILTKNIAKLQERYKGKFNENGAIDRDLGKEREILEEKSCAELEMDAIVKDILTPNANNFTCIDYSCTIDKDFGIGKHLVSEHAYFEREKNRDA